MHVRSLWLKVTAALTRAQGTAYMGGITAALGPNIFTDIAFDSSVRLPAVVKGFA